MNWFGVSDDYDSADDRKEQNTEELFDKKTNSKQ